MGRCKDGEIALADSVQSVYNPISKRVAILFIYNCLYQQKFYTISDLYQIAIDYFGNAIC